MNTQSSSQRRDDKQIASWLLVVAGVIFCMIILGGVTRLTHSGLSMVDWKPIMGVVPPMTETDWLEVFDRYQQFPEYGKVNSEMSLDGFKSIFYFEYCHRMLGRMIGLLFLLPFLFFWFRGSIKKSMLPQMVLMFVLGGFQGLLGWYMVKSGLVNDPHVSQYRLSAHLVAAVTIYCYILWVAFGLLKSPPKRPFLNTTKSSYRISLALMGLIIFMIISGGFVAGTRAGFAYNTFPLMAGRFIPESMYVLQPFWLNWFENVTAIQFNHRMIAYLLLILVPVFARYVYKLAITPASQRAALLLVAMLLIQLTLGITTLLLSVPVVLASAHQGGAIILLSITVYIAREFKHAATPKE